MHSTREPTSVGKIGPRHFMSLRGADCFTLLVFDYLWQHSIFISVTLQLKLQRIFSELAIKLNLKDFLNAFMQTTVLQVSFSPT